MKAIFSSFDTYLYHIFIDLEEKTFKRKEPLLPLPGRNLCRRQYVYMDEGMGGLLLQAPQVGPGVDPVGRGRVPRSARRRGHGLG